jgi:hypothetical protein
MPGFFILRNQFYFCHVSNYPAAPVQRPKHSRLYNEANGRFSAAC